MTMLADTRPAIFTIELPDGTAYTGKAIATEFSMHRPVIDVTTVDSAVPLFISGGEATWDISLRGTGALTVITSDNLAETMERQQQDTEYKCPYCGKINPVSSRTCGEGEWDGCGASRPAVYGVGQ
jgi:hypothetical protein